MDKFGRFILNNLTSSLIKRFSENGGLTKTDQLDDIKLMNINKLTFLIFYSFQWIFKMKKKKKSN